jgi:hypothetical protein
LSGGQKHARAEAGADLNPEFWSISDASFLIKFGIRKGAWDEKEAFHGSA